MMAQHDMTPDRVFGVVSDLIADDVRLAEIGRAAAALGSPDAADRVVELLDDIATGPKHSPAAHPRSGAPSRSVPSHGFVREPHGHPL